jgi:hypothetical protein
MSNLSHILSDKGMLVFSTLTEKTFMNLKQIFNEERIVFPGPTLFPSGSIIKSCEAFADIQCDEVVYTEHFSSLFNCLKHIQKTGAGNASGVYTNPVKLKNILKKYPDSFDLNYHILFISAKKMGI